MQTRRKPRRGPIAGPAHARHHLAREVAIVLVVKCVALSLMWWLWFAQPESKVLDAKRIGALLYGAPAAVPHDGSPSHARP